MPEYQPGDILLNTYQIQRLLGQGAFGDVYQVRHVQLKVDRAIKILKRDSLGVGSTIYTRARERFLIEAQLGAQLKAPNLVEVYDFQDHKESLMLVMEYCPGGNLLEWCSRKKKESNLPTIESVLAIFGDIASGLAALHAQDIVHRDLKPGNILFDQQGRAKVADLGLAQMPGGSSQRSILGSQSERHPGTPAYMSPEQENSCNYLTLASDIYSLGLIIFELLTGRSYKARPWTRAISLRSDMPGWLDDLVSRMLEKDSEKRIQDVKEILVEISKNISRVGDAEEKARLQKVAEENTRQEAFCHLESERKKAAEEAVISEKKRQAEQEAQRLEAKEKVRQEAETRQVEREAHRLAQEPDRWRNLWKWLALLGLVLALGACLSGVALLGLSGWFNQQAYGLQNSMVPTEDMITQIARTVNVQMTRAADAKITLQPSSVVNSNVQSTLPPTLTLAPPVTDVPSATASPIPCNWALFITETIPDGTAILAGTGFVKSWRLKNIGTCTWTSDYQLVFVEGEAMGAPAAYSIFHSNIPPGGTVDVNVSLTAPAAPGIYQGFFKLRAPDGTLFGMGGSANGAFWAKINSVSTTIQPSAGTPLPDLQITAITFNPASPTHGVPAHISITIYNAGSAATNGSFTVKWWGLESYAQPSCAWVVNDVLVDHGGKVVNCDYIYPNPYAPNLLSKAQVDTENNITENDEGNNGLKVPVTVQ